MVTSGTYGWNFLDQTYQNFMRNIFNIKYGATVSSQLKSSLWNLLNNVSIVNIDWRTLVIGHCVVPLGSNCEDENQTCLFSNRNPWRFLQIWNVHSSRFQNYRTTYSLFVIRYYNWLNNYYFDTSNTKGSMVTESKISTIWKENLINNNRSAWKYIILNLNELRVVSFNWIY